MTSETENWESFMDRFKNLSNQEREVIDCAYQLAKSAHRKQLRDDGTRFFEHPRSVALILADECSIRDFKIIAAALLHDSAEDSAIFGNSKKFPYLEWITVVEKRLSIFFGKDIADMICTLTKPHGTDMTGEKSREIYLNNLELSAETILIKMADRLHNLRSLPSTTKEKQMKYLEETPKDYFPIFGSKKVVTEFPVESSYLIGQMQEAIEKMKG